MASYIKPDGDQLIIKSIKDIDLNALNSTDSALLVEGGAWVGGHLYIEGSIVSSGDVITLGNASGSVAFNSNISTDLLPSVTKTHNIGSSTNMWDQLNIQTVVVSTKTENTTNNKRIVVFGDSLTAGYGLEDVKDAYPGLLQQKIDSLQLGYTVINSGISGETTAGGKNRIDWVLNQKPSVFILELGANDGLRGVPLTETKMNLQYIINARRGYFL